MPQEIGGRRGVGVWPAFLDSVRGPEVNEETPARTATADVRFRTIAYPLFSPFSPPPTPSRPAPGTRPRPPPARTDQRTTNSATVPPSAPAPPASGAENSRRKARLLKALRRNSVRFGP